MQSFEDRIKHYIRVHRELHGMKFSWDNVHRDFMGSFPESDAMEVMDEIERQEKAKVQDDKKYGLFVGRCMPFTNGHDATAQDIIRDGRIPIFVLGGKGEVDDRHPLSFEDRVKIIKKKYPFGVKFIGLEDKDNWDDWYNSVKIELQKMGIKKEQIILYAHNKPEDNKDFEYNGVHYKNESYTKMFEENGVQIKEMDAVTCKLGHTIHATDVRASEEVAIRNLDARIYRMLKDKFGWWKDED